MLLLLLYLLLTLPFRGVIRMTRNYNRAIRLRKLCRVLLFFFVIIGIITVALDLLLRASSTNKYELFGGVVLLFFLMPLYYYYIKSLLNVVVFYDESIISELHYYILYLRSFKDDQRRDRVERKCMEVLYNLFCPFAVGVPSEFSPSEGAPRIYIGDKWKEQVGYLMHHAPLVFFRINDTENFLWEVEQCLNNNCLDKSLFWITNASYYQQFAAFMKEKGVELPSLEKDQINSILYFGKNNEAIICPVKSSKERKDFYKQYKLDKADLLSPYSSYFYGYNEKLKLFVSRQYDLNLLPEARKWSIAAILFPEYYIITHSFPYKYWSYIALLLVDALTIFTAFYGAIISLSQTMLWLILFIPLFALLASIRIAISYFMGRNARTMVWLSEKWISSHEYQQSAKRADILTYILGISFIISVLAMIFFML